LKLECDLGKLDELLVKMRILDILWVNEIIGCNKKITTDLNQELTTNK
jgi:hypothetical protein